jgi:pyruvate dehydrogenase E1 component alpha subunit
MCMPRCYRPRAHAGPRRLLDTLQVHPCKAHKIEPPSNVVETSIDELLGMYELMYKMRRMEIAADMMYKAKLIRGFCHL